MAATNTQSGGQGWRASRGRVARRPAGFTLVEILVVLAIIVVLVGILMPAITKGYRNAVRSRMTADLSAIALALEAYRQDHGDFPRVDADPANWRHFGDALLCRTMLAPLPAAVASGWTDAELVDGQDGNGFRVRPAIADSSGKLIPQGKQYGPYLSPDKFKSNFDVATKSLYLADSSGVRILYLPGRKNANVNVNGGYVADVSRADIASGAVPTAPMFNLRDLRDAGPTDDRMSLFDHGTLNSGANKFRVLLGAEAMGKAIDPQITGEFLLWGAGPDEKFGYDGPADLDPAHLAKQRTASDDVSYPAR